MEVEICGKRAFQRKNFAVQAKISRKIQDFWDKSLASEGKVC
jgi:hypothetical protein